jgi:oligoendopeptidase F
MKDTKQHRKILQLGLILMDVLYLKNPKDIKESIVKYLKEQYKVKDINYSIINYIEYKLIRKVNDDMKQEDIDMIKNNINEMLNDLIVIKKSLCLLPKGIL